ncbi:MAG: hypothetical protein KC468_18690, partial [Myxococcales bacterium]|nr:hypothetical protein [Myxococcales bacterium]
VAMDGAHITEVGFGEKCADWRGRSDPAEREAWSRLEVGVFALGSEYDAFLIKVEERVLHGATANEALATVWQESPAFETMIQRSRCYSRPDAICPVPSLAVTDEQLLQAVAAYLWPALGPDDEPVLLACTGTNGLNALPESSPDELIAVARVAAMVSPAIGDVARDMYATRDAPDGLDAIADASEDARLSWSFARLQATPSVSEGICEVVNDLRWWADVRAPMCISTNQR